MRLAIDMALILGLREQELMHACWADVDFHHATYRVTGKPDLGFVVKDAEERLLNIHSELLTRLQAERDRQPKTRLILGTRNDAPNGHLLRSLKRLAQKAGLNCGRCESCLSHEPNELEDRPRLVVRKVDPNTGQECAEWTLHKFRRTCLTTMLRQGVDAKSVQNFAGHAELDTTLKYLAPALGIEMQAKVNAIQWGNVNRNNEQTARKKPLPILLSSS
jgi:integrase